MPGRESVAWSTDLWARLDQAVHDEVQRSAVATSFLPIKKGAPIASTVPADVIDLATMTVDPSGLVPIMELSLGFGLTQQQVDDEAELNTAVTLSTRAANLLAQVEDLLVFQGAQAVRQGALAHVQVRGNAGPGLLRQAPEQIPVVPVGGGASVYGEHTFEAVVRAISLLEAQGEAGPYALAVAPNVYADSFVPTAGTLIMAADQIRPLVTKGFVTSGAIPPGIGLLLSLGGNTVDLVVTVEPTTEFVQMDVNDLWQFRVFERLALRVKDPIALIRLVFQQ